MYSVCICVLSDIHNNVCMMKTCIYIYILQHYITITITMILVYDTIVYIYTCIVSQHSTCKMQQRTFGSFVKTNAQHILHWLRQKSDGKQRTFRKFRRCLASCPAPSISTTLSASLSYKLSRHDDIPSRWTTCKGL